MTRPVSRDQHDKGRIQDGKQQTADCQEPQTRCTQQNTCGVQNRSACGEEPQAAVDAQLIHQTAQHQTPHHHTAEENSGKVCRLSHGHFQCIGSIAHQPVHNAMFCNKIQADDQHQRQKCRTAHDLLGRYLPLRFMLLHFRHRKQYKQNHGHCANGQQSPCHGVPAGNIRSPVANDALAAAGADALNEEQEVHKKAGRNGKHTGRDQVHVGVQQCGCAHGKKHSHKQQQIGVRSGKQQHGCAPQKGIQQHGLAAAQNIHPEAADGQKHEVADVAYGDDLGQLGGTQLEVGREDRGKNAPHGIVRAQTHHQDQERGKRDDVLFLVHWFVPQKKPPPGPTRQKGPAPMRRLAHY